MVSLREAVPQKLQLCGFNRFKKHTIGMANMKNTLGKVTHTLVSSLSKAISAELPVKIESWCIGVVKISMSWKRHYVWIYIFQQRMPPKKG